MKKLFLVLAILLTNIYYSQNVGISATSFTPDASAMLDVSATNKGILVPRLALVATNNSTPITSPTVSLLVYNTATASTGSTAVSPGFYYWDGSKWISISGGTGGKDWSLLGNAGTIDGTNFIGTADGIPLNFRVNNQKAGRIDHLLFNSFYGYQSPNTIPTGSFNVANGAQALYSITSGSANVANGYQALYSTTTGSNNSVFGHQASFNQTTGANNSAFGYQASYSLATNSNNSAFGYQALYTNRADNNTAMGTVALKANTSGTSNSGFGYSSLTANTTGASNSALGFQSLKANTTGNFNTGIGMQSLNLNSSGSGNTALGVGAGLSVTTGSNNTFLGYNADIATPTHTNVTSIGFGAITYTSNTIQLGNSTITSVISSGNDVRRNPTLIAINASATAAASDIINGYITSTSAAAVNITLPTITSIATQLGGAPSRGTTIDFIIDNSAGANSITLILDPSITTAASPAITGSNNLVITTTNSIGMFRLVFTSGTAAKIFRVY